MAAPLRRGSLCGPQKFACYPQKTYYSRGSNPLLHGPSVWSWVEAADFGATSFPNQPSGRHDDSLRQTLWRVSDRTLIFGRVCFTIGVWLGRLTADKPVLWGLLGS